MPLHDAVPLESVGHAVHEDVPHEFRLVLSEHAPPQRWKPPLQAMPQLVPLHDGLPCGSLGHVVHDDVPHELTLLLLTHALPHTW